MNIKHVLEKFKVGEMYIYKGEYNVLAIDSNGVPNKNNDGKHRYVQLAKPHVLTKLELVNVLVERYIYPDGVIKEEEVYKMAFLGVDTNDNPCVFFMQSNWGYASASKLFKENAVYDWDRND